MFVPGLLKGRAYLCIFLVIRIEPRALYVLDEHSPSDLYLQLRHCLLKNMQCFM